MPRGRDLDTFSVTSLEAMNRPPPEPFIPFAPPQSSFNPILELFRENVQKMPPTTRVGGDARHYARIESAVRRALEDVMDEFIKSNE